MTDPLATSSFDAFWSWLLRHPNCIVRAGTPETQIFDDEDLHWHFANEGATLFVQVIRGKRLMGELLIDPEAVAYVQAYGEEPEGEFAFELISETETDRVALYFFVLSHGMEGEDPPPAHRPGSHSVH